MIQYKNQVKLNLNFKFKNGEAETMFISRHAYGNESASNKLVNADLKHLVNWLNANKVSLSVKKKLKW